MLFLLGAWVGGVCVCAPCGQDDAAARKRILQMADFIKLEAKEKAHEIRRKVGGGVG